MDEWVNYASLCSGLLGIKERNSFFTTGVHQVHETSQAQKDTPSCSHLDMETELKVDIKASEQVRVE